MDNENRKEQEPNNKQHLKVFADIDEDDEYLEQLFWEDEIYE